MLFTHSMVVACSLVRWFIGCCLFLFGSSLRVWGPGAIVGHVRAFSLDCSMLFSFVYFGFAELGSCASNWRCFFFFFLALCGVQVLHL
jgi:hypothetical protein